MITLLRKASALIDTDRSKMRGASAALAKVKREEGELEAKLAKMNAIVADADAAEVAFHKAVAEDERGDALFEFADGSAPDGAIARLVVRKDTTAHAAMAARAAAPKLQARLAELREQISSLEHDRGQAVRTYLRSRAQETFDAYDRPWRAVCAAYDRVVGIRRALRVGPSVEPLQGPRFDSPERSAMKHTPGDIATQTQGVWEQARQRLEADPDAFVDDLIGSTADKADG